MFVDYVQNGQGFGDVGRVLNHVRFDPGMMRPYFNRRGERCVTINTGRIIYDNKTGKPLPEYREVRIDDLAKRNIYSPVANATTLRKEDWIQLDKQVVRAARQRLRAWADLMTMGSYGGFNAMAKTTLEYEAMSDPGEAMITMDAITPGRADRPQFKLRSLPLPITFSDFYYSSRELAVSRNSDTPLDTTSAEAHARRVAESVEKQTIGIDTGVAFGTQTTGVTAHDNTSKVYGYTTLPQRITKTNMTIPTGANAASTINDLLVMRQTMYDNKFYGPFLVYHSTDWDKYLDNDYILTGGNTATQTLRERLKKIDDIVDVRRLDFLTNTFTMLMVQMQPETARAINGMDITTMQWEEQGGLMLKFKVMCIQVPQLRYDYNGVAAILHGTTA